MVHTCFFLHLCDGTIIETAVQQIELNYTEIEK
jgi:hypothetical protein